MVNFIQGEKKNANVRDATFPRCGVDVGDRSYQAHSQGVCCTPTHTHTQSAKRSTFCQEVG